MASSTLLYIAWPLTLGLSFLVGGMIPPEEPTTENLKNGNHSAKTSRTKSSSNSSNNQKSAMINRRSSATGSRAGKDDYSKTYDIKEITNTEDPQKRLAKLLAILDQLGPGDFEQILADFSELGMTQERITEYKLLINAWAKINPEGALAYAKEKTRFSFASNTIINAWAEYAPNAAIQWAKLNHEGNKANPYLVNIIESITSTDLDRATEIFQELPYSRERGSALYTIVKHVSKLGPDKANAWLATIKDEKLRATAAKRLSSSVIIKKSEPTAEWMQNP